MHALIKSVDLWILFFALSPLWGGGATFISNAIQIYDALAETYRPEEILLNSTTSLFERVEHRNEQAHRDAELTISLMGAGSGVGRILVGVIEAGILQPYRLSATILLPIPALLMAGSNLLPFILPSDSPAMPVPFVLNALAYGSSWAVVLLSVKQMIGLDIAQFYMFLLLAGASTIVWSRLFLAPHYDDELHRQGAKPGRCVGIDCVSVSLYVMAIASGVSFVLGIIVHWRWMRRNGLGYFSRLPLPKNIVKPCLEVVEDEENLPEN